MFVRGLPNKWIGIFDEDDLVQEVLIGLSKDDERSLLRFDPLRGTLRDFVYKYTATRLLDILRKERRRTELYQQLRTGSEPEATPAGLLDQIVEARQRWRQVLEAIRPLLSTKKSREMFELIIVHGSTAEQCRAAGIERKEYHRWRHRLFQLLQRAVEELERSTSIMRISRARAPAGSAREPAAVTAPKSPHVRPKTK
jgi:DNA-directed RNA polymerase specialized sigma24 family protein